jgi:hypothetical protein
MSMGDNRTAKTLPTAWPASGLVEPNRRACGKIAGGIESGWPGPMALRAVAVERGLRGFGAAGGTIDAPVG